MTEKLFIYIAINDNLVINYYKIIRVIKNITCQNLKILYQENFTKKHDF